MSEAKSRSAYSVLGLHKGVSDDEIKQAYVSLVKKYDPEVHTDRFMIIQKAFEKLRNPELRAREDILTFNFVRSQYVYSKEEQVEVPDAKVEAAIKQFEGQRTESGTYPPEVLPKLITAYLIRARKNVEKKLLKEAMDDWMRVLQLDPTHQRAKNNLMTAFIKLGYSYANHQLYDEAIELWEKAAKMDPDNEELIHNLALACENAERTEAAERYWDETLKRWNARLERNPEDKYWKNCIIEVHRHQNELGEERDTQKAVNEVRQGAAQPSTTARASDTNPPLAPMASRDSTPPPPPPRVSRPAAAGGGPTPAPAPPQPSPAKDELARCREIVKLNPEDFDANMRIGNILMERKQWPEAEGHLEQMHQKWPRNVEVLNSLGWAQMNNQNVEKAFRTWKLGLKIDKKNFAIREALAKAHMMMGRGLRDKSLYINSLVHFKELTKLLPDSDEVHYELAKTYQLKGDLRSAYGEFQKVIKLNPKHKEARKGISELKLSRA